MTHCQRCVIYIGVSVLCVVSVLSVLYILYMESYGTTTDEVPTTGYINAGGRGTRLSSLFTPDPETGIAKALLEIGHPPLKLIDHHVSNLRQQNIEKVVVAAGDQSDLYEYIQDSYQQDRLLYVTKSLNQLGTGGDLISYARTLEEEESIIVQNVDTILDIDLEEFSKDFTRRRQIGAVASIALTLNRNVPNEDAYLVDSRGNVVTSAEFANTTVGDQTPAGHYRASSTGAVAIMSNFLRDQDWQESDGQLSLYGSCLRNAWQAERLHAYSNGHNFFRDVGTVNAWLHSQDDIVLQELLQYN